MTIAAAGAFNRQFLLLKYYELPMRCEDDVWSGVFGGIGGIGHRKCGYHDTIGFAALIEYKHDSITLVNTFVYCTKPRVTRPANYYSLLVRIAMGTSPCSMLLILLRWKLLRLRGPFVGKKYVQHCALLKI